jgi:hypothetical protein
MHSPIYLHGVLLNYFSRGAALPFMGVKRDVLFMGNHISACEEISKEKIST